jgi:subtilisin family serine protease
VPPAVARFRLDQAPFAGRTGRGVVVAVVDSGVRAPHPHVPRVLGGLRVTIDDTGERPCVAQGEFLDRLGHGTAVAAAVHEKAPDAELLAVKVFDDRLATSAPVLAYAIEVAVERGARLINLSLGTPSRRPELEDAVRTAAAAGALVVSALGGDGAASYPGALPGVVAVRSDARCPRDQIYVQVEEAGPVFTASPYPRPIPGVPPERNLSGASFAVANATGFLARLLETARFAGVADVLQRLARE